MADPLSVLHKGARPPLPGIVPVRQPQSQGIAGDVEVDVAGDVVTVRVLLIVVLCSCSGYSNTTTTQNNDRNENSNSGSSHSSSIRCYQSS
jgi:hypothetical protein